ncbi:2,3-dimethylmalate lyase [Aspergillus lentulus]|uniref:2,3-dimethylmalate lyase n=1 Tax=Aspergillus lentulus TaxID=293939 RepID=A0AAN4TB53_ASPLE|nr:2,3-dimethylmalate lyase [Aspergillus lentulus]
MSTIRNNRPTRRFREALKQGKCLIGPGVFDGISTRVASQIGFDFLYLAGSGATGSYCGEPDLSVMTQTEFFQLGRMLALHTDTALPIIADADTGFGGPLNISRTVRLYEHAGIAGLHIEDQVFPKRCGQLQGKDVVDLEVFIERVRSAVEARQDPDFVIIARTDARQAKKFGGANGGSEAFHDGIKRLKAAVTAGGDMVFMESPRTEDESRTLVKEMGDVLILINVLPNGLTPNLNISECNRLGFRAAIYPCTWFIPAMLTMQRPYGALKATGTDLEACKGQTIKDFFDQVGLSEAWEFDARISNSSEKQTGGKAAQEES